MKQTGGIASDPDDFGEVGFVEGAEIGLDFIVGSYAIVGWPGDINGPGLHPIVSNRTTALYYATTLIGGDEDPQFATIKDHSYVGIQKILNINTLDQSISVIDKDAVGGDFNTGIAANDGYESFHRYITNDFPTGAKLGVKVLDNSVQTALKDGYYCKMNKGYLLKTFSFTYQKPANDPAENPDGETKNTMYLYESGSHKKNFQIFDPVQGFTIDNGDESVYETMEESEPKELRFRFANNWSVKYRDGDLLDQGTLIGSDDGGVFDIRKMGPNFASASIHPNQFTNEYYSGSFGFLRHNEPDVTTPMTLLLNSKNYQATALGSASKFIGIDTLNYLRENAAKTELHITFIQGTKDFAPGSFDERSIGTFEVDSKQSSLDLVDKISGFFPNEFQLNGGIPKTHELILKGGLDARFKPTGITFNDTLMHAYVDEAIDGTDPGINTNANSVYATIDRVDNAKVHIQGGVNGMFGVQGELDLTNIDNGISYGPASLNTITESNTYSGSLNYELSFLKKDHTLIINLDKKNELFDGIGEHGVILIPHNLNLEIRDNLDFYIQQASAILGITGGDTGPITYQPENPMQFR